MKFNMFINKLKLLISTICYSQWRIQRNNPLFNEKTKFLRVEVHFPFYKLEFVKTFSQKKNMIGPENPTCKQMERHEKQTFYSIF